ALLPARPGARQAIGKMHPDMQGQISCSGIRAPTAAVSLLDLVVECERELSTNEVNSAYEDAAGESLKGILAVSHEPLVSVDYKKNSHSAVIDALSTGTNGGMVRILAWYDNEWAYSKRLIDTFQRIGRADLTAANSP